MLRDYLRALAVSTEAQNLQARLSSVPLPTHSPTEDQQLTKEIKMPVDQNGLGGTTRAVLRKRLSAIEEQLFNEARSTSTTTYLTPSKHETSELEGSSQGGNRR